MNTQVRGMNVAIRNANDGISLAQTADGALASVSDALQRMRELAVQARNSTNSPSDKDSLNQEYAQLGSEIQRVLGGTTFNGATILGAGATTLTFQVGANVTANDSITISTINMAASDVAIINVAGTTGLSTQIGSLATDGSLVTTITALDAAIDDINSKRAVFGASQNRFSAVITNLQSSVENQSAARSRIMDADFASETAAMSRAQILQQAGTAMVAQANQIPQQVLKLLQG
jgi:flagellin